MAPESSGLGTSSALPHKRAECSAPFTGCVESKGGTMDFISIQHLVRMQGGLLVLTSNSNRVQVARVYGQSNEVWLRADSMVLSRPSHVSGIKRRKTNEKEAGQ